MTDCRADLSLQLQTTLTSALIGHLCKCLTGYNCLYTKLCCLKISNVSFLLLGDAVPVSKINLADYSSFGWFFEYIRSVDNSGNSVVN